MERLAKLKFMVVDDMMTMRKLIAKELKAFGVTDIVEAKDGKEALDLLKAHVAKNSPVGFLLTDWNMPVMNGIELVKACRNFEGLKNLPIVMVTAEADLKQQKEALAAGIDHYINKPLENNSFKAALLSVFEKRTSKV
jgi:two-component system chemotaxis response regulator CheY